MRQPRTDPTPTALGGLDSTVVVTALPTLSEKLGAVMLIGAGVPAAAVLVALFLPARASSAQAGSAGAKVLESAESQRGLGRAAT